MGDKRSLIILVAILGLVLIGGGWWFFNIFSSANTTSDFEINTRLIQATKARNVARDNINNFLNKNILEGLEDNEQYQSLNQIIVEISLDDVGNPEPFTAL